VARRVFFSFHYEDVSSFRANVVRNSWVTHDAGKQNTFSDSSIWEAARTRGPAAIKALIDEEGLHGTSVTVVLIGQRTHERRWVKYEIVRSFERGNGIVGVHINRIRDKEGYITSKGLDPLERIGFLVSKDGKKVYFYELVKRKWRAFADLPQINNKKSNSLYFAEGFLFKNAKWGEFLTFGDYFKTYCWDRDDGFSNLSDWVEAAATAVGR